MRQSVKAINAAMQASALAQFSPDVVSGLYPGHEAPAVRYAWLMRRMEYLWALQRTEDVTLSLRLATQRVRLLRARYPDLSTTRA